MFHFCLAIGGPCGVSSSDEVPQGARAPVPKMQWFVRFDRFDQGAVASPLEWPICIKSRVTACPFTLGHFRARPFQIPLPGFFSPISSAGKKQKQERVYHQHGPNPRSDSSPRAQETARPWKTETASPCPKRPWRPHLASADSRGFRAAGVSAPTCRPSVRSGRRSPGTARSWPSCARASAAGVSTWSCSPSSRFERLPLFFVVYLGPSVERLEYGCQLMFVVCFSREPSTKKNVKGHYWET